MSASDDDLRAALARAADDAPAPADPVGRVRATVDRRRRRRSRVRLASASTAAAAVLVGAVTLAPGQLQTDPVPPAVPEPSATQGTGALLDPDGLPGLTLGSRPDLGAPGEDGLRPTGSGCTALQTELAPAASVRPDGLGATELVAYLRDGEVVSLVATLVPDRVRTPDDVPRTWLGPTLGSPLSGALALPGARLVKDDPLGDAGPEVSNVVVDAGDGVELVYSDVPAYGRPSDGTVSTMVLRTEAGQGCGLVPGRDLLVPGQGDPGQAGSVVLDAGGSEEVRLGGSAAAAVGAGSLAPAPDVPSDPLGGRTCTAYTAQDGLLDVWADGDSIVGIGSSGGSPRFEVETDPAVRSGQPLSTLSSLPGTEQARPPTGTGEAVDVVVAPGVRGLVWGFPSPAVATTTGVVVEGPPAVAGVLLYLGGDEPSRSLCTP